MAERALATAFVNIVPGTKDLEGYLKGKLQDDVGSGAEQAGGTFSNKFGKGLMGLGAVIGGAFAVTQISQFVGGLVTSAEEGQRVDATLQNITSSMGLFGSSTDTVVSRLQDYATAAMGMTGIDDDLIKGAQAKLMTFGAVAESADTMGGAFDRATALTMDLSAAGFGSLDSASVMLGKALNDPIAGIASLSRVGVQLTDSQKAQIQGFMDVGDVASAQNVILGEVEKQVGGTAEASATAGDKMKAKFDDVTQSLGTALLPAFEAVSNFIANNVVPVIAGFAGMMTWLGQNMNIAVPAIILIGGVLLAAFLPAIIAATAGAWAFTVALLANPITWIVLAVVALIAAIVLLVMNWDAVVKFLSDVWNGFVGWLMDSLAGLASWWGEIWSGIAQWATDVWNGIVAFFQGVLDWIVEMFLNWTLLGIIISNWDAIVAITTDVWNNIIAFFVTVGTAIGDWWTGLWEGIVGFFSTMWNGYVSFVQGAFTGLLSFFTDVGNNISNWWNGLWTGIIGFFEGIFSGIGSFVDGIFNGVIDGILGAINWVIGIINGFIDGINMVLDGLSFISGGTINLQVEKLGTLTRMAKGGYVDKATPALIGEAGPEVVTPLKDFERMIGIDGSGRGQTVNYYAAPNESLDAEQALFTALQRAKVLAAW
jgi:phage-related protein